jgi:hypothetical protein
MGAPGVQVAWNRVDDLAIEIKAQVVARREVGEPAVPDADHPPVDLLDHGVGHGMGHLQRAQIAARLHPAVHPAMGVLVWRGEVEDSDFGGHDLMNR